VSDTAILIKGGRVMTPDADPHVPAIQDVLIEGQNITGIGIGLTAPNGAEAIDATDRLVVPGFINAHYHSHDTLGKGVMEETPLETWRLLALPPAYPKRSREEIKARKDFVRRFGMSALGHDLCSGHGDALPVRPGTSRSRH